MRHPTPARPRRRGAWWLAIAAAVAVVVGASACEPQSGSVDGSAGTTVVTDQQDPADRTGDDVVKPSPASLPDGRTVGTTVSVTAVRAVDFADFTFPPSACAQVIDHPPAGGYELHDGRTSSDGVDGADPFTVRLRPSRSYGDVDGDGNDEVALVLDCDRGGAPVPVGWLYGATGGRARPLARVQLDADSLPLTGVLDTALAELHIHRSEVVTTWDVYLDGDALCCPARTATVTWTWDGSSLVPGTPLIADTTRGH